MVLQDDLQEFGDETVVLEPAKSVAVYVATGKNPPADAQAKPHQLKKSSKAAETGAKKNKQQLEQKEMECLACPAKKNPSEHQLCRGAQTTLF